MYNELNIDYVLSKTKVVLLTQILLFLLAFFPLFLFSFILKTFSLI